MVTWIRHLSVNWLKGHAPNSYTAAMGKPKVICFAIFLAVLSDRGFCSSSLKEFYVKPTGSRAECPSPCHSLKHYADNSSFTTNNSKFIFLEGEHHLGTVVNIRNVANLSMVGNSSGVKIRCGPLPSGFHIEGFVGLNITNMSITNCKEKKGSAVHLETGSEVSLNGITISSAEVDSGTGLAAVSVAGTFTFIDCTFENNSDSAIFAKGSKLTFEGRNLFRYNKALLGGAVQLHSSSSVHFEPSTHIHFEKNHADYAGGAIYTDYTASDSRCFFSASSGIDHPPVDFIDNTASFAGTSLYGDIQKCCAQTGDCEAFYAIFNITNTEADPTAIASDPYQVCFCEEGKRRPNCSSSNKDYNVFPGQVFSLPLAIVGKGYKTYGSDLIGVVPGAIHAFFASFSKVTVGSSSVSRVGYLQYCEYFNYSVYGHVNDTATHILHLAAEQSLLTTAIYDEVMVNLHITLKACPAGFVLGLSGGCECDPILAINNIQCYISNQSFERPKNYWLGFINDSSELVVAFVVNCPIGYCTPDVLKITRNTSNSQCESNRAGLLCGKCQKGYSLTLANGKCAKCSNTYLLLLFPFAVAGLLLVVVLFALNLTVTEGSINGLIFYANVLSMSNSIQLSKGGSIAYALLAWINLDLGIATCLYDGMDGYSETWLEFVFPAYLLLIIIAIILFYRKFPALAHRVCGENAVKVIATPLLLFYTKLQRTVAIIFSSKRMEFSNGVNYHVWVFDANVEYFKGKHLYLGIAGIFVLVFVILPYALCLTFFQQLQACSGHRLFQWVNKLKPVFDAYAGPYKDKYRFWTGMLLLVRTLLIILFTVNYAGSVEINMLIILVVSSALVIAQFNGIYKKWPCNFLEAFFYAQLIVLAAGVLYATHNNLNVTVVADTSIVVTVIVFLALLGYHATGRLCTLKKHWCHLKGYADVEEDFLHSRERDSAS